MIVFSALAVSQGIQAGGALSLRTTSLSGLFRELDITWASPHKT